ncbi:transporter substrate-binding domain-containing protein [Rheinheimera baltica]|uniref:substrate-binding periplasmic protein n=1 Tax=Rheinheimera baltica TaxID=67576 RepID=UPI00273F8487|nr:transporter substrate-binding domain-containing protein [Rheinheimera baltica]MDP5142720.1 transporter substrate-binding domain-containing protein [Rheinheimera baltica]MDP5149605.1 transporter substrate-binding domain-containing protein [Rheinheimera baltica]
MGINRLLQGLLVSTLLASGTVKPEEPLAEPAQAPIELVWCLDHFSRFHNYEDVDKPFGPSVDLMQELARRVGFVLRFTPRTVVSRCFKLMEEGKVDLMSNLKFSDQRNQFMFLLPYETTVPESVFMRRTDKRAITSYSQLKSLTVASIRGYLFSQETMRFLAQNPSYVAHVESIEVGLEMLNRGRIDALISPTVSTSEAIFTVNSYDSRFRIATLNMDGAKPEYINIGLSRASPHMNLLPNIKQHLNDMQQDGTVKRLYTDVVISPRINELRGITP